MTPDDQKEPEPGRQGPAALRAGPTELVVDLAATTFLDAGGISVLLQARHEARRAGRHLRITNPQQRTVRRVLEITGTFGVLTEPSGHNDVPCATPRTLTTELL